MIGGRVMQVVRRTGATLIEVLDTVYLNRCWREVRDPRADVAEGDRIWWQGDSTFVTRRMMFAERDVGKSYPAAYREPQGA